MCTSSQFMFDWIYSEPSHIVIIRQSLCCLTALNYTSFMILCTWSRDSPHPHPTGPFWFCFCRWKKSLNYLIEFCFVFYHLSNLSLCSVCLNAASFRKKRGGEVGRGPNTNKWNNWRAVTCQTKLRAPTSRCKVRWLCRKQEAADPDFPGWFWPSNACYGSNFRTETVVYASFIGLIVTVSFWGESTTQSWLFFYYYCYFNLR